jgi:two-component system, OmpR family, sensor histidine kinase VicK
MLQKNFAALNRGEEMHNYASKWRTKTGEIRHVLIDSNIHRGKDGGIRNTRCFIRDGKLFV